MNIIILGSSGGLGSSITNLLSKEKANNLFCFQRKNETNVKRNCNFFYGDLNNFDQFKLNIDNLNPKLIFNALICNFGVTEKKISNNFNEQIKTFENTISNNLFSTFKSIKYCLKKLEFKKNNSSFVFISSLSSHLGFPNNPGYISSKGALNSLTRSLMRDYLSSGFRFNSISPGYIKTKMTLGSWHTKRKFIEKHIPLRRWGKPDEIANVVEFLISTKSSYINGQDLIVDGGWSKNSFYIE